VRVDQLLPGAWIPLPRTIQHLDRSTPAEALRLGPPLADPSLCGHAAQLLAEYGVIMPPAHRK
jgi:hypothetical protein